ncbi:MAG: sigma factor [Pseudonocardia sp.]
MATALDIEAHRPHLIAVGYRLTGSRSDAADAVQDAWLRLRQLTDDQRAEIRDLRAWLTTAVGRLCLDRLRSAAARRESYVGPWLPEPLVSTTAEDDPLTAVVRAVADAPLPPRSDLDEQQRMLANIADAIIRGDSATLVSLLHPDAVLISNSGGMAPAARRVVHGADKVARLLIGLANRHGTNWLTKAIPVMVNGEQGYWTPGIGRAAEAVTVFSVADGLVVGCYSVLNPAKLSRVPGTLRPR